jgi:BirA family biotin operon repressor/biotin-[acetyl-CoA-carboxylase] ligase
MTEGKSGAQSLLHLLREQPDTMVSGSSLSDRLGVSRTAIWKWVNSLRREGYRIDSTPSQGYRFVSAPDIPLAEEVADGLNTRVVGRQIRYLKEIDSTNRLAMDLGRAGEPEGVVVVADGQTQGKGRLGRPWVSPPRSNLYFSVLLRPPLPPQRTSQITLITAVSLCAALHEETALPLMIKWPNDLWVHGKKLGGILAEMSADMDRVHFVVIGVGININQTAEEFPAPLKETAISVAEAAGRSFSRVAIFRKLLAALDRDYARFCRDGFSPFRRRWTKQSMTVGQEVSVHLSDGVIEGTALSVNDWGALQVRRADGTIYDVVNGDVVLRPKRRE